MTFEFDCQEQLNWDEFNWCFNGIMFPIECVSGFLNAVISVWRLLMELVWIAILSVFLTAIVLVDNLKKSNRIEELEEMLEKQQQEENPDQSQ